jgi:hypothetical protein
LVVLHKNFMALTQDTSADILDSVKPLFVDSKTEKIWRNYLIYQGAFAERIDNLRTQARETPSEDDHDKIMPSLLKKWTGGKTANQPTGNYSERMSCAFSSQRVESYEKACKAFPTYLKMSIKPAATNITKLLIFDIAYLKSWEVEWEQQPAALAGIDLTWLLFCLMICPALSELFAFQARSLQRMTTMLHQQTAKLIACAGTPWTRPPSRGTSWL